MAVALAEGEYEKYRVEQDKNYISDFDREVKKILDIKRKIKQKGKPVVRKNRMAENK